MEERIKELESKVAFLERVVFHSIGGLPTEEQMKVIKYIEENLGIEFKGFSKENARLFISKNMRKSKEVR